jgi:hypothetical protein
MSIQMKWILYTQVKSFSAHKIATAHLVTSVGVLLCPTRT